MTGAPDRHRALGTFLVLAAALVAVTALLATAPGALQRTGTEALVKLVVVVGLWIFVGHSGVVSFGHVAFMAIAGYGSAVLSLPVAKKAALLQLPEPLATTALPVWASAGLGVTLAGLVALLIGVPLMRLRGIVASMATFAVLAITHVIAQNWQAVTGGRQALVGVVRVTDLWLALAGCLTALAVATLYRPSRHGLLLRCARENEIAAAASGIDVSRERLVAFVLSALVAGLGGVLYVHFLATVTAGTFHLDLTFVTLAMLVVGGMRSLTGAVVGTALVSIANEALRTIERGTTVLGIPLDAPPGLQEIGLALLLLLVLLLRPAGLMGDREAGWRGGRPAPSPGPVTNAQAARGS